MCLAWLQAGAGAGPGRRGGGGGGGRGSFSKDDIQKHICIKFNNLNYFFLNIHFLDLSHSNKDSAMNMEFKTGLLVKFFLKLTKSQPF